jgi:hypothetical protein
MVECGRMLVPLLFNDGDDKVSSIEDLKKYWNTAHIEKIIEYIYDGRLERFFFALRKDELKQLIVDLKSKGTSELDIINEVGSKLGFEPVAILESEINFIKPTVPLKEVFTQKGELKLLPGEWNAQNINVVVNEPLTIIGSGNQKTLIHTGNLSINANGGLILEDLTFKAMGDTGEVRVKEGEVIFKNVHFSGVKLYIEGGKAITEECLFENLSVAAIEISEEGDYESRVKIDFSNVPPNAQIRKNGIDIRWKKDIALHLDKENIDILLLEQGDDLKVVIEKIPDKKAITLLLKPGTYNLDGYTIKNKKLTFKGLGEVNIIGSINIEDSEVIFENIQFEDIDAEESKVVFNKCKGKEVIGKASQITINSSEIHGNEGNGIWVKENSILTIKDSKVYENGTSRDNYPQIWVENSKAEIINSLVYDSIDGTGIYGLASQITINSSEIHGNKRNGINVKENSTLKIKDSKVYENGNDYAQIYIEKSKAEISNSNVYNSKGGTGIYGKASQITINSSEIHGNEGDGIYGKASQITINSSEIHGNEDSGIWVTENSILTIKDSKVYENGKDGDDTYPQIWVENSKAEISNSNVYNSKGGAGIYIAGSKVELINVKTWGNDYGLEYDEDDTYVSIKNCDFKDGMAKQ